MELDKLHQDPNPNPNPNPPMSGAYIRSLVKNLRTKDPIDPNPNPNPNPNSSSSSSSSSNPSKMAENQKPQHHKKQVRRRLHTTRPYQERLLNMAEARREIVTALKYHRASMKKAASAATAGGGSSSEQQQTPPEPPAARCLEGKIRPRKIQKSSSTERNRIYPQSNLNYNNNNNSNSNNNSNNNMKNLCYPSMNAPLPIWSMNPQSVEGENNLDIVLPEQTLGLNLNLKDFTNLDANLFSNGSVSGSGSGSSSSCSPSLSVATDQEGRNSVSAGSDSNTGGGGGGGGGMHVAVGEEEMAEMKSIGEKHEMEWSDKMNMMKSAWWLRFMKKGGKKEEEKGFGFGFGIGIGIGIGDPFDQILEFPDWMNNGNERCFEEQLLNDYCSSGCHDPAPPALPCMDIGEFEGMDGEWLA